MEKLNKREINKKFDAFQEELETLLEKYNMEFETYGHWGCSECNPYAESDAELRIVYKEKKWKCKLQKGTQCVKNDGKMCPINDLPYCTGCDEKFEDNL